MLRVVRLKQRTAGRLLPTLRLPQRADVVGQRRHLARVHDNAVQGHPRRVLVIRRGQGGELGLQRLPFRAGDAGGDGGDVEPGAGRALRGGTGEVRLASRGLQAEVKRCMLGRVGVVGDGTLLVAVAEALRGAVLARDVAARGDLGVPERHNGEVHDSLQPVRLPALDELASDELLAPGSESLGAHHHVDGGLRENGSSGAQREEDRFGYHFLL
jgi:hypothetical protein